MIESNMCKENDGVVVIMTCDSYQKFWHGLYHYMNKHWDFQIPWKIYLCTEEIVPEFSNPKWNCLATGRGTFDQRQKKVLDHFAEYDYVFFMLEDFWPNKPMTHKMFSGLFEQMRKNDWDCLHIDTYRPELYKVNISDHTFEKQRFFEMRNDSNWFYNQQAAFWKRDLLKNCTVPGAVPEEKVMTTLSFEQECDIYMRKNYPNAKVMLYHYWWYPRSGVGWRGEMSMIGQEMNVHMNIDFLCEQMGLFECYVDKIQSPL